MEDFKAFLRFIQDQGVRGGRGRGASFSRRLAFFGVWVLIGVALSLLLKATQLNLHLPSALGSLGVFLCLFLGFFMVYSKRAQERLLPSEDGTCLGPQSIDFGQDGVTQSSAHMSSHVKWPAVQALNETESHFFLMIDTCAAHIIPKRSFAGEAQIRDFIALVHQRLSEAGKSVGPAERR